MIVENSGDKIPEHAPKTTSQKDKKKLLHTQR